MANCRAKRRNALGEVESDRATATPELASQVAIAAFNPPQGWLQLLQDLQNDVINAEHVAFLRTRGADRAIRPRKR